MMLKKLSQALAALTDNVHHYTAAPNSTPPYLVWAEDGANDLTASNVHAEQAFAGTVDLYTKTENDPLMSQVPQALEAIGASWYLNAVQYEDETGLIHYEWVWEVPYGDADV